MTYTTPPEVIEAALAAVLDEPSATASGLVQFSGQCVADVTDARRVVSNAAPAIAADAYRAGLQAARDAAERRAPEMGSGVNVTQYREGLNDGVYRALRAIDALLAKNGEK